MAQISLNVLETERGLAVCPAGASMAGKACTVTNASRTRGASTAPATSPGSASVRPTGADSSATKVRLGERPPGRGPLREGMWGKEHEVLGMGWQTLSCFISLCLFVEYLLNYELGICLNVPLGSSFVLFFSFL